MAFLRVVLVRHGQSSNNVLLESGGVAEFAKGRVPDAPLTPLGLRQAKAVAAFLASQQGVSHPPITAVYTSAMARAVNTACEIGAALGSPPIVWADLHEIGGCYTQNMLHSGEVELAGAPGMSVAELAHAFPSAVVTPVSGVDSHGWWKSRHAERAHDAVDRLAGVLHTLRARAAALAEGGELRESHPLHSEPFLAAQRLGATVGPQLPGPAPLLSPAELAGGAAAAAASASSQGGFAAAVTHALMAATHGTAVDHHDAVLRHGSSAEAALAQSHRHMRCETIALVGAGCGGVLELLWRLLTRFFVVGLVSQLPGVVNTRRVAITGLHRAG